MVGHGYCNKYSQLKKGNMEKSQKAEVCSNDDILMGRYSEDPLSWHGGSFLDPDSAL